MEFIQRQLQVQATWKQAPDNKPITSITLGMDGIDVVMVWKVLVGAMMKMA